MATTIGITAGTITIAAIIGAGIIRAPITATTPRPWWWRPRRPPWFTPHPRRRWSMRPHLRWSIRRRPSTSSSRSISAERRQPRSDRERARRDHPGGRRRMGSAAGVRGGTRRSVPRSRSQGPLDDAPHAAPQHLVIALDDAVEGVLRGGGLIVASGVADDLALRHLDQLGDDAHARRGCAVLVLDLEMADLRAQHVIGADVDRLAADGDDLAGVLEGLDEERLDHRGHAVDPGCVGVVLHLDGSLAEGDAHGVQARRRLRPGDDELPVDLGQIGIEGGLGRQREEARRRPLARQLDSAGGDKEHQARGGDSRRAPALRRPRTHRAGTPSCWLPKKNRAGSASIRLVSRVTDATMVRASALKSSSGGRFSLTTVSSSLARRLIEAVGWRSWVTVALKSSGFTLRLSVFIAAAADCTSCIAVEALSMRAAIFSPRAAKAAVRVRMFSRVSARFWMLRWSKNSVARATRTLTRSRSSGAEENRRSSCEGREGMTAIFLPGAG